MNEYKTIEVGKNKIDYIQKGEGKDIIFFHGFGIPPNLCSGLIDCFASKYKITAPKLTAINYLKVQPKSLNEYVEIARNFMKALDIDKRYLIGQSCGGSLVLELLKDVDNKNKAGIAINPILPTKILLPKIRFSLIALYLVHENSLGKLKYMKNFLKDPLKSRALVKEIGEYSWEKIHPINPSLMIHSNSDEFFKESINELEERKNSLGNLELDILEDYDHMWYLNSPQLLFEKADKFFSKY
ncbi:MAG: alpha/beta hydrolase [Candidatus Woesearchaeota archaeon]|jgi:pimeloyl-ACP methyl ester carboxylesterase|nr:alpha/beta hydrolase [Candidatus Woesearchaeota archaeon]